MYASFMAHTETQVSSSIETLFRDLSPKTFKAIENQFNEFQPTLQDIPFLLKSCENQSSWAHKVMACKLFNKLTSESSLRFELHRIIPILTDLVHDAKLSVGEHAMETLKALFQIIGNRDLEPYIPTLLHAIAHPGEVDESIHQLSAIVFVQQVDTPALSILVPILLRGFTYPQTAIQRRCCVITENMSKLVDDPKDICTFLPQLLPCVQRVMDEIADPECRTVAARVYQFLQKQIDAQKNIQVQDYQEEEGEDLCNCEFSLAYGAKILLNRTQLRLKKGGRYGVCGKNGCGKSTLMRAIANDQVDGFPTADVLKRIYVEHDIDGNETDTPVLDFVGRTLEVEQALKTVGFDDNRLNSPIGSLSGGWKMKLALARAMLQKPDILLLDEPTNHLDVDNVKWLQNYLIEIAAQKGVTCLIVSHDSGFLDAVCTHIIYYENIKLKTYRGNLSAFVEKHPEAQSYYELNATPVVFKLPEPGFLEGVKTKDKAILKMNQVSFAYPSAPERQVLQSVNAYVSLSSRIGCIGPNGAGKSTLIKLLTGEMEASQGTVWKHPNLRIAYVAQHAFHHIEQHLDMTANEYIRWRYATGEDRESEQKVFRKVDEEEKSRLEAKFTINGVKRQFEKLIGRRKLRNSYEYEVQWLASTITDWLERDELITLGFEKYVNDYDMKEAAQLGLMMKPLTQANVEKHLADLGLESEVATHNRIRGYSGGQKVRLVIGAATWMNPHIIVLDEPSNYLDRDSLGALSHALKEFGGGVVIISHNREFLNTICSEIWTVADGRVEIRGETSTLREHVELKVLEDTVDAFGNTIKVKGPKKTNLSNKEKKARERARKARRERGEEVSESEED